MKKIILTMVTICAFGFANAQREGGFRVGLDLGVVPASKGLGISFALEPKYNIKNNMSVGLKFGGAAIVKDIYDYGSTTTATISAIASYTGTFDYYFPQGTSFVPFVGGGIGYNGILNVKVLDVDNDVSSDLKPKSVFGGMLRGGFEWGKFRMGLEYNLLPKSEIVSESGSKLGDVSNSYLAINLGFYVGGGKWKENNHNVKK